MRFNETSIKGIYVIELINHKDDRGNFVKTFHADTFEEMGLTLEFKESYYSTSMKGVIRGMHFQLPPYDHDKLVYTVQGNVLDVLLDLRKDSGTYGQTVSVELSDDDPKAVFIPKGIAHGFTSLSDAGTLIYNVTTMHHRESDIGILWNSFGYQWPVENPIISSRDQSFVTLDNFRSPF